MRIKDVVARIEKTAPPRHAASWDNCGVQIAGTRPECAKLALALDPTPDRVKAALDWGADLILTHHPLLLKARLPNRVDAYHAVLRLILGAGAWLYAAHTSLDVQLDGPAGFLAEGLGLGNRTVLEPVSPGRAVLVRLDDLEAGRRAALLAALKDAPACLDAAPLDPSGLEFSCFEDELSALTGLVAAHCGAAPVMRLSELLGPKRRLGYGLAGDLPEALPFAAFAEKIRELTGRDFWIVAGEVPEVVRRAAYCTGSGGELAARAFAAGADVYLTGDVKYHPALEVERGLLADVGHFVLEERMMGVFADRLSEELSPLGTTVKYFFGRDPFSVLSPGNAGNAR